MSLPITVDIEPTNRCNAKCYFCPRDQTPHQGLMSQETFDQTLRRAIELRDSHPEHFGELGVSLCGLGEPLINPKTPAWVGQVRQAGFECVMSSNGALLDERRGRALLDSGLQIININVGDEGEEYESVYKLPFQKTLDNVLRFKDMAGDQCQVNIVLVDYRMDRDHLKYMVKYWQGHGFEGTDFVFFDIMNRGGALFVDHMQFESYPELQEAKDLLATEDPVPFCGAPFVFLFVGYDANYYLCCSDWKKEVPLGNVYDSSFAEVTREKLRHVTSRTELCRTCNWDPVNRITEMLRAEKAGEETEAHRNEVIEEIQRGTRLITAMTEDMGNPVPPVDLSSRPKKLIEVTAG